jgi:4-alpha-glucanotransferase
MIDFKKRASGILLHITSLPSNFGIGDLGPAAYDFVDFLYETGQKFWQILPLTPVDDFLGDCPYSSSSAFAGNELLISPEIMAREGWLQNRDLEPSALTLTPDRVDYSAVRTYKTKLFDIAYGQFKHERKHLSEFSSFCRQNAFWLDSYALFVVLKKNFNGAEWNRWPEDIRMRKPVAVEKYRNQFEDQIGLVKFLQYVFYKQWGILRNYCRKRGIQIIGDLPIYVSYDSADVWGDPEIFKLNEKLEPTFVAGVPPDYFSATGQRWGNPVYDWNKILENNFEWWLQRILHNFKLLDIIRIDHFRGLIAYWQIPASEPTAINGEWQGVPYEDFFAAIQKNFKALPIIAEDLGIITDDVRDAMEQYELPGMKVLQFAFNGDQETHPYLPHNYTEECVVYTGTHDNNTTRGWYEYDATEEEKENVMKYLKKKQAVRKSIHWDLIGLALNSKAWLAVIPLQDVLGLGREARMNIPGTMKGNWEWRLRKEFITPEIKRELKKRVGKSDRI